MVQTEKFGKYDIVRKLSRSMTDVYLVRDTVNDRMAVLKLIEHSRDEFTKLAIEAETRGAALQKQMHDKDPRILEVYECGEQNNFFFVSLEYFEGRSLAEILSAERRLHPMRAARYAAEACSQLQTLHSFVSDLNGRQTAVVHGDVKPANVQIGMRDDLKLLDFGIAKMITATHNLTRHNLGSPSYCSPERLSNAQVDVHSDLWAIGVTLFEMLSGSPPYQAQDTRRLENLIQSRRPPRALPDDIPVGLKAIVSKALAGDINHRYHSATDFEKDLLAFLQQRAPAAANQRISWDANATLQKPVPVPANGGKPTAAVKREQQNQGQPTKLTARPNAPQKVSVKLSRPPGKRWEFGNLAIAHLAGILAGLLMLMPVAYYWRMQNATEPLRDNRDYAHEPQQTLVSDWTLYQSLRNRNSFLGPFSPVAWAEHAFRNNLLVASDNVIDGYRNSSDTRLSDFDWARARTCLRYALQIDQADSKTKGKLALTEGYLNLVQNPRPPKASLSIDSFRQAASYMPRSVDPHLGLARLYVYGFHNIGEALPEFQQAERLGFHLGPREATEQADGYLYRSEWELSRARRAGAASREEAQKWLDMAKADAERARALYEPLVGYSNVSANLEQIYQDRNEQIRLAAESLDSTTPKAAPPKHSGFHRWP